MAYTDSAQLVLVVDSQHPNLQKQVYICAVKDVTRDRGAGSRAEEKEGKAAPCAGEIPMATGRGHGAGSEAAPALAETRAVLLPGPIRQKAPAPPCFACFEAKQRRTWPLDRPAVPRPPRRRRFMSNPPDKGGERTPYRVPCKPGQVSSI